MTPKDDGIPSRAAAARLRALMLYAEARIDGRGDAHRLDAIAFHADMTAYRRRGWILTGATYVRTVHGPAPRVGALRDWEQGSLPKRIEFTAEELAIIDDAIAACDENAHERSPAATWKLAAIGEVIPEYVALLETPHWQPDRQVLAVGKDLAARL